MHTAELLTAVAAWLVALAVLVAALWSLRRLVRRHAATREGLACRDCRYPIRGREAAKNCSECGADFARRPPMVHRSPLWFAADAIWTIACLAVGGIVLILLPAPESKTFSFGFWYATQGMAHTIQDAGSSPTPIDVLSGISVGRHWVWPSDLVTRRTIAVPGTVQMGRLAVVLRDDSAWRELEIDRATGRCRYELRGGVFGEGPLSDGVLFEWLGAWGYPADRPDVAMTVPWITEWLDALRALDGSHPVERDREPAIRISGHVSVGSRHATPALVPTVVVGLAAYWVAHRGARQIRRDLQDPV